MKDIHPTRSIIKHVKSLYERQAINLICSLEDIAGLMFLNHPKKSILIDQYLSVCPWALKKDEEGCVPASGLINFNHMNNPLYHEQVILCLEVLHKYQFSFIQRFKSIHEKEYSCFFDLIFQKANLDFVKKTFPQILGYMLEEDPKITFEKLNRLVELHKTKKSVNAKNGKVEFINTFLEQEKLLHYSEVKEKLQKNLL